jgi:hypothetical protein
MGWGAVVLGFAFPHPALMNIPAQMNIIEAQAHGDTNQNQRVIRLFII